MPKLRRVGNKYQGLPDFRLSRGPSPLRRAPVTDWSPLEPHEGGRSETGDQWTRTTNQSLWCQRKKSGVKSGHNASTEFQTNEDISGPPRCAVFTNTIFSFTSGPSGPQFAGPYFLCLGAMKTLWTIHHMHKQHGRCSHRRRYHSHNHCP